MISNSSIPHLPQVGRPRKPVSQNYMELYNQDTDREESTGRLNNYQKQVSKASTDPQFPSLQQTTQIHTVIGK